MSKKKLERFAQIADMSNVFRIFQNTRDVIDLPIKGKWHKDYFKNNNPIIIECGCGRGEYTVELAKNNSDKNYIGLDLKGNRIWLGATQALNEGLNNVAFVRCRIECLENIFANNEVSEVWITFPDPQPGSPRERKRLTSDRFLNLYRNIMKPKGTIHLKTDSDFFFDYTQSQIIKHNLIQEECTLDLYGEPDSFEKNNHKEIRAVKTYYEKLFSAKGFKIKYCRFILT